MGTHVSARILILALLTWFAASAQTKSTAVATGVVNDAAGKPVADATVVVYSAGVRKGYSTYCPTCYVDCGKRAATDATGKFTIAGLDDQLLFNLLVLKEGYAPIWIRRADPLGGPLAAVKIATRPPVNDGQRVLRGRVVDENGSAMPYALVELEGATYLQDGQLVSSVGTYGPGDLHAVANDRGDFELDYGAPAKSLLVFVSARSKAPRVLSATTGLDRKAIVVTDGATIRGRLLKYGKPMPGVALGLMAVSLDNATSYPEERIGTDEKGRFLFTNVPSARVWDLYAKLESLAGRGAMEPLQCATERDGQNVEIGDIQLQSGLILSGRVELTDGKPIPEDMRVFIGPSRVANTLAIVLPPDGSFVVRDLVPGAYVVMPAVKGYRPAEGEFLEVLIKRDRDNRRVIRLQPDLPPT